MNDPKNVELMPREWQSDRPKSREPIFGPGLPDALAYAFGWLVVMGVIYLFKF